MSANKLFLSALMAAGLAATAPGASPAGAVVASVTATPAKTSVAATGSAMVTVNWTVERLTFEPPNAGTIASAKLRVLIDGAEAASLPHTLSRAVPGEENSESLRLREVVRLPRALVQRAVKQGSPLILERRFTDSADNTFETASVEVTPSGPGAVPLTVQRLALSFEDGTRTRVLPRGGELRAVAEINTAGHGLLAGVWEGAFGASAEEPLVYHPIMQVRQGVAGGGRTVITSPPLPTGFQGYGFVRFRVSDPETAFATSRLHYYVAAPAPDAGTPVADILLMGPAPGDPMDAASLFSWRDVSGAARYELMILPAEAGPAVDGPRPSQEAAARPAAVLPGGETETRLEPEILESLPAQRSYLWQVVAYDARGAVIGSSSLREIFKP